MATDMPGLLGAASLISPFRTSDMQGLRQDMFNIRYPKPGHPGSLYNSFNVPGWPNGSLDPTLSATDPTSIANLVNWWRASDFDNIANGTEVTEWYDHSGLGRGSLAIGATGNRYFVTSNALNGNMTAVGNTATKRGFTSAFSAVDGMALTSKSNWTLFAVINFTSNTPSENNFFGITTSVGNVRIGINSTGPGDFNLVYPNIGNFRTTTAISINTWHYIILVNASDVATVYVDGVALTWASAPGIISGNAPREVLLLDEGGTGPFIGLLAEAGLYNSPLTNSSDRSTLYNYFRRRYGLI